MEIEKILERIEKMVRDLDDNIAVPEVWNKYRDPFKVLVATVISIRTREEKTFEVCERLFSIAKGPKGIIMLSDKELKEILKGVGLYNQKVRWIKEIAKRWDYSKKCDEKFLKSLPGVGRKVLNVYLSIVCKRDVIAVDTHVHRIFNRLGIVNTKNPEETEKELYKIVPKKYWGKINKLLVLFGRNICKPINPRCNICELKDFCKYYRSKNNKLSNV